MSDMVLVALSRKEAQEVFLELPAYLKAERRFADALSSDPSVLEEQIARAIGETGGIDWDVLSNGARAQARKQARAVLRAITGEEE